MQLFARWTNLSETTFVLASRTDGADYLVRIFTPSGELPFAGHPTLGTCHAWLEAGGRPADPDAVVQECGAGLMTVRRGKHLAFAAPPLVRGGPVEEPVAEHAARMLKIARSDIVDIAWADNGPGWVAVLLASAEAVLAVQPDVVDMDIGVAGLYPDGSPEALEVRAFSSQINPAEDPVTGSLNASLGQWLLASGRVTAPYVGQPGHRARPPRPGARLVRRQRSGVGRRRHGHLHQRHGGAVGRDRAAGVPRSMLAGFERSVGFAEGVVMSFDPDVLLPSAFAVTVPRGPDDAVLACRNEQLDRDFLKFRDLATAGTLVGVASRDSHPARASPRWREILDVRGHGHELRAALVDASGQCWGAVNLLKNQGTRSPSATCGGSSGEVRRDAAAIARSMVAGAVPDDPDGLEPGSVWLDDTGAVVLASPAARKWLDLLDAQAPREFARATLAALAMRAGREENVALRVRTADGRWVRARAERITSAAGRPHGVMVVIDAARAGSVLPWPPGPTGSAAGSSTSCAAC